MARWKIRFAFRDTIEVAFGRTSLPYGRASPFALLLCNIACISFLKIKRGWQT